MASCYQVHIEILTEVRAKRAKIFLKNDQFDLYNVLNRGIHMKS